MIKSENNRLEQRKQHKMRNPDNIQQHMHAVRAHDSRELQYSWGLLYVHNIHECYTHIEESKYCRREMVLKTVELEFQNFVRCPLESLLTTKWRRLEVNRILQPP